MGIIVLLAGVRLPRDDPRTSCEVSHPAPGLTTLPRGRKLRGVPMRIALKCVKCA